MSVISKGTDLTPDIVALVDIMGADLSIIFLIKSAVNLYLSSILNIIFRDWWSGQWKSLPFFLLVLVVFLAGGVFFAGDTARAASDPLVRVRLSSADPYIYFRVEDGTYELVDLNTSSVLASPQKGELWRIDKEGSGFKISVADTQLAKATGPLLLRQKNTRNFYL